MLYLHTAESIIRDFILGVLRVLGPKPHKRKELYGLRVKGQKAKGLNIGVIYSAVMPEMSVMSEFSALAEIIERNRKYSPAQEERLKQEPLGDWQSPSDGARWDALRTRLDVEALSYNIRKSVDKKGERDFLIAQKIQIQTELCKEGPPQEKPVSQILYSLFCTGPSTYDIRVNEMNKRRSNMMVLLRAIDEQLPVYDTIISSIKIRVSRRMSLDNSRYRH